MYDFVIKACLETIDALGLTIKSFLYFSKDTRVSIGNL